MCISRRAVALGNFCLTFRVHMFVHVFVCSTVFTLADFPAAEAKIRCNLIVCEKVYELLQKIFALRLSQLHCLSCTWSLLHNFYLPLGFFESATRRMSDFWPGLSANIYHLHAGVFKAITAHVI